MLHQLGVHADGRKARQGVQLIAEHPPGAALNEEVAAGQAGAAQRQIRLAGLGADLVELFLAQMRGDDGLGHAVFVLVIVGVELGPGQDLARAGRGDGGRVIGVADGGALDLLRVHELLKHDFVVLAQGDFDALFQRGAVRSLGDADAGPRVGGLDEDGVAEFCLDAVQHYGAVQLQIGAAGGDPLAVGDPGGVHQGVGDGLIHADGAAQHAAAHIGDAGQLKQALDRAVLAVFAVHDGCADVNVDQLRPAVLQQPNAVVLPVRAEHAGRAVALLPAAVGHSLGRGAAGQPAAILRDTHGENLIFVRAGLLTQCAQPGRGRHAADVMFTGNAAEEQCDAQLGICIHQKDSLCSMWPCPLGTLQVFSLLS